MSSRDALAVLLDGGHVVVRVEADVELLERLAGDAAAAREEQRAAAGQLAADVIADRARTAAGAGRPRRCLDLIGVVIFGFGSRPSCLIVARRHGRARAAARSRARPRARASRSGGQRAVQAQVEHRLQPPAELGPLGDPGRAQIVAGDLQADVAQVVQPAPRGGRAARRARRPARRPRPAGRAARAPARTARAAARRRAPARCRHARTIARSAALNSQVGEQRVGGRRRSAAASTSRSRRPSPAGSSSSARSVSARSGASHGARPSATAASSAATGSGSPSARRSSLPIRAPDTVSQRARRDGLARRAAPCAPRARSPAARRSARRATAASGRRRSSRRAGRAARRRARSSRACGDRAQLAGREVQRERVDRHVAARRSCSIAAGAHVGQRAGRA